MNPREPLRLACAAEDEYVRHIAAMLLSAFEHCGDHRVEVYFLHGPRLSQADLSRLVAMVEGEGATIATCEVPDERLAGVPVSGFSKATWYRVFLPDLLHDVDRVLYLDADVLVLDSLVPLWQINLEDHAIAAVTNVFQEDWVGRAHQLGIPPKRYFNGGVLMLDLERMRRDDVTARLLAYGARHEDLALKDQDALNVVLGDSRLDLHPRWNCMNSTVLFPAAKKVFGDAAVAEALQNPAIRHFEGPGENKPWHYLCERDMREIYTAYRARTPWPRVRREGVTPANIARSFRRRLRA